MFSFARSCICQSSICFYQKFNLLMQLTCMQTEAWISKKCICTFNSFSEIQCSFTETWIQMFSFATGCQNCTSFGKSNIYLTFAVDTCKQKLGWQKCICTFPSFFGSENSKSKVKITSVAYKYQMFFILDPFRLTPENVMKQNTSKLWNRQSILKTR